jgi:aspartyl/glutamyl-tRNA(Asn/Gln) amidotransferase C subunit
MSVVIKPDDVRAIASLARLSLNEQEITNATKDLSSILENFSEVQKIDTKNTPPSDGITGLSNIWREDVLESEVLCSHQELLDRAPATTQRHIKVKAVF